MNATSSIKNKLYSLLNSFVKNDGTIACKQVSASKKNNLNKVISKMQTISRPVEQMKELDFRPKTFDHVVGQEDIKENFKIKITAFNKTKVSLVHTLFLGFSGVGKTTLANVVANEMGVNFHQIMATRIKTWADFYNIIKDIEENDVVFIDEIHALAPRIQEHLYGVMEDFTCTVEDKNLNKQVRMRIPRFTLIGATTHTGDLKPALLSRFQHKAYLMPYSVEELTQMVISAGERIYNLTLPHDVAEKIAQLSRRTARIAYNLLRSYMDVVEAATPGRVTSEMLSKPLLYKMLKLEKIDPVIGLDYVSRKYLVTLLRHNSPIGLNTLPDRLQEQASTVTSMIEPFLLSDICLRYEENGIQKSEKSNFISITSKGRVALPIALNYIKLCQSLQKQGWFSNESLNVKSE